MENGTSNNNTTLVAGAPGGDTNSTLVANNAVPKKLTGNEVEPVAFITLTADNRKFPPIERAVIAILRIGRFVGSAPQSDDFLTFKSKVISRNHAEIWSVNAEVYVRDTRSQSGTFLNAMRLSEPGKESKPYRLKPGDVIQFGVDYKGATEDNARCVSVRVDLKQKMVASSIVAAARAAVKAGIPPTLPQFDQESTLTGGGTNTSQDQATLVTAAKNESTLVGSGAGDNMPQQ